MVMAGAFEEIIFRGIIFSCFEKISPAFAVAGSALLFALGHSANLLSGQDLFATFHQIIFALLFGLATAEIVRKTQSITFGIAWHSLHNVIALLTGSSTATIQLAVLIPQLVLLAVLSVFLKKLTLNTHS